MIGRKSEFAQYKFLVDGLTDEILKKRVEISLRFYITRANKYGRRDNILGTASIVMPAFATFAAAAASFYEAQYPSLDLAVPVITLIAVEKIIEDGYRKSRELEMAESEKKPV